MMKKIMVMSCILLGFLLAGCSVEFDTDSSKTEKFEDKAEALGNEFDAALEEVKQLEKKEKLTSEDQKRIVTLVDDLTVVIEEFKDEKAPMFNWAKDFSADKLMEKKGNITRHTRKSKRWRGYDRGCKGNEKSSFR